MTRLISGRGLRVLAVGTAVAMAASACGGGGEAADQSGPVTVTIQEWNEVAGTPMEQAISDFEAAHPDITIELAPQIPFGPEYDTRMRTQLGAGSAPTIFRMNDDLLTSVSSEGVLKDLTPYLEGTDTGQFIQPMYEFGQQEDGTYTGLAIGTGPRVVFYNKTMFEEAGLPLPPTTYTDENWKWEDFLAAAQELTVPGEQWGAVVFTDEGYENTWSRNNGSPSGVFGPGGTTFTLSEPVAAAGLQYVADLSCVHEVQPPWSELLPDDAAEGLFGNGQLAMLQGAFAQNSALNVLVDDEFEYDIAPVPGNAAQVNENSLYVYTIPESTPDREAEAAWEFMSYLAGPEGGATLAEGNYYVPINAAAGEAIQPQEGESPQSMEVLTGSAAGGIVPNFPPENAAMAKQLYRPALEVAYNCERPVQEVLDEVAPQVSNAIGG